MRRSIGTFTLGFWMVSSTALAAPFGGTHTGCSSPDKLAFKCSTVVGKALAKLEQSVLKCHLVQASHAYKAGHSSPGFDNAEENCTTGPSATSAKAKFDAVLAKYGPMCGPTLVADAEARRDAILADQANPDSLDARNGLFFCDATSGLTIAEPGGSEAGWIPADANGYKCSVILAKIWLKLQLTVRKCHTNAAKYAFAGAPFDDLACVQTARAKFDAMEQKLIAYGFCPACVTTGSPAIGDDAIADLDAQLEEIYPCPPQAEACNDLGGGQCNDTCATAGFECVFVPVGFEAPAVGSWPEVHGQDDCRCVPADYRCENLSSSVCLVSGGDGLCANASESCVESGGICGCQ